MPTTLSAAPDKRSKGGGNLDLIVFVKRNADGTFATATVADPFGATAGTVHTLGSHESSKWARDDKGLWSKDTTLIDMDIAHKNLLEILAPVTAQSQIKDPDLSLEDGTQIAGQDITGDTTKPYCLVISFGAPIAGKEQIRYQICQFDAAGGWDQKNNEFSKPTIKMKTVDASGFVCVNPAGNARLTAAAPTAPTLTAPFQHGKWVEGV